MENEEKNTEELNNIENLEKSSEIQQEDTEELAQSIFEEESSDPGLEFFWEKLFRFFFRLAGKLHFLQSGYLHFYILIMTAALVLMLVWGFLLPWAGTLMKGGF